MSMQHDSIVRQSTLCTANLASFTHSRSRIVKCGFPRKTPSNVAPAFPVTTRKVRAIEHQIQTENRIEDNYFCHLDITQRHHQSIDISTSTDIVLGNILVFRSFDQSFRHINSTISLHSICHRHCRTLSRQDYHIPTRNDVLHSLHETVAMLPRSLHGSILVLRVDEVILSCIQH